MQLYVHIPFCKKKCRYCAFVSFPDAESQAEKYIGFLLKEAEIRKEEFSEGITTVFIGGGTPSLLSPELLTHLTGSLFRLLPVDGPEEFTIEANPGTVKKQWLQAAVRAGMNRLSLGMQAFQPDLLKTLGRIHSFAEVENTVALARDAGIGNISIDLIFGIPGQTMSQWEETLDAALSLNPVHISAYGLIPEEDTPLFHDLESGRLSLPDPEMERMMYDTALSILSERGFWQYEVSNFALPGFECRHNTGYWRQVPYVGLGISASSMAIVQTGANGMTCRRRTNPATFSAYEDMVSGHGEPAENVLISPAEARFETMMLGLRMNEGVSEAAFQAMHGISLEQAYGSRLRLLEKQGLMAYRNGSWMLTRRGFDIQNSILVELMDD